jgi:hypothetical protein
LALRNLGLRARHFPSDDDSRREIAGAIAGPAGSLRLTILDDLDAITDTPVCCVYKALDGSYPGSRFILTSRERRSWLESCRRHWQRRLSPSEPAMVEYLHLIRRTLYGSEDFEEDRFSASYDRYVAGVLDYFGTDGDRLLVMDICMGDGWSRLCPFLGLAEPGVVFPHQNRGRNSP